MRKIAVLAVASLMLVAAACSKSSTTASSETSQATTTTQASTTTSSAGGSGSGSTPSVPAGQGAGCEQVMGTFMAIGLALAPNAGDLGDVDIAAMLGELRVAVPAEIQDDVDVFIATFNEHAGALAKLGNSADPTAALADPEVMAAMAAFALPAMQTASTNIQAWADKACPNMADLNLGN